MLIVDNSILSSVATCSTQAALQYVLGYTTVEERAPLRAGAAVHAALASYLLQWDVDAALAILDREYAAWAEAEVPPGDRLAAPNVRRILRQWMETHPAAALPFRVLATEVPFRVELTPTIELVGRFDALGQDAQQAVTWVIEVKTTGRLDERWRRRMRTSSQLTGYTWAAVAHTQAPVVGAMVIGIQLSKLPDHPTRKCKEHGVPYLECGALHATFDLVIEPRAPHQQAEWVRTAAHLAYRYEELRVRVPDLAALQAVRMQGAFTGACVECQFADFCALGRPIDQAAVLLRHEPWSPYAHAFKMPAERGTA